MLVIYEDFRIYFYNNIFKKEFIEYYGETMYQKLLEIYNTENESIEQIRTDIETFLSLFAKWAYKYWK